MTQLKFLFHKNQTEDRRFIHRIKMARKWHGVCIYIYTTHVLFDWSDHATFLLGTCKLLIGQKWKQLLGLTHDTCQFCWCKFITMITDTYSWLAYLIATGENSVHKSCKITFHTPNCPTISPEYIKICNSTSCN